MKRISHLLVWSIVLIFISGIYTSCRKNKIITGGFELAFDTDTLMFDTVFTKLGSSGNPPSVYRYLTVYNNRKETVKFDVRLAGGNSSVYRMNVDGFSGTEVKGYELKGGDSMYIFVEAHLEANNQLNPAVVTDSILFDGGIKQGSIKLVAWGWDAYYFNKHIIRNDTTWKKDKPIVIYNYVAMDENKKLTIEAGTKIYTHSKGGLYIFGTLEVKGDTNSPVVFQGDRLEWSYRNADAQWKGIEFAPGSLNNKMTNCIVKNGVIGVQVDSMPIIAGAYNLQLENVQIHNMSQVGLLSYHSKIKAVNCLIANCGQYTFAGPYGGDYDFNHCTFVSYNKNNNFSRKSAHFGFSNQPIEYPTVAYAYPLKYIVKNCIVYGDQEDEIEFGYDPNGGTIIDTTVSNCLIKTKKYEGNYKSKNCRVNEDPKFISLDDFNYDLDSKSPMRDVGTKDASTPLTDIKGRGRDNNPDWGCYEWIP